MVEPVYAEGRVNWISYEFSPSRIYQGDTDCYVDLKIKNSGDYRIRLHGASIHFDWQQENEFFKIGSSRGGQAWDLSVTIDPNQEYTFRIPFDVDKSVSAKAHYYYFEVYYDSESWGFFGTWWTNDLTTSWNPVTSIQIHNAYEKILMPVVLITTIIAVIAVGAILIMRRGRKKALLER